MVPSPSPTDEPSFQPTSEMPSQSWVSASPSPPHVSEVILFVVDDGAILSALEELKTAKFIQWGYDVIHISANAGATEYDDMVALCHVVYIGENVPMGLMKPKLIDESFGIIMEDALPFLFDPLKIGGSVGTEITTDMNIDLSPHFITEDFPATIEIFANPSELRFLTGNVGPDVTILGRAPGTGGSRSSLLAYAKDVELYAGKKVAGRRVFLPVGYAVDLTLEARILVRRSIKWCIGYDSTGGPPPPPPPPPPTKRRDVRQLEFNPIKETLPTPPSPPPPLPHLPSLSLTTKQRDVHQRQLESNSMEEEMDRKLLAAILKSDFHGASGPFKYGKETEKGRNSETITIGVYNVQPLKASTETGRQQYEVILVGVKEEGASWQNVPNTTLVYRDGTTTPSGVLRRVHNENYISRGVQVSGLVLFVIALLIAIVAIALLIWLRNDPAVERAQPFFMVILCAGSAIMSVAIFTLSFDEGAGWNNRQLSVACSLTPWFFFTGQILVFCALFTKLYRLDRVLQMRLNGGASVYSALWPLLAFVATTLLILTAHSICDPWSWERVTIKEIPAETYGECTSNHQWIFFGLLTGVMFISALLTMFFAWKTVDAPGDFRDSGAVVYTSFVQLQAWAVGVPMMGALGHTSADATYFARIMLIFVFSISGPLLITGPKIVKAIRYRLNPNIQESKGRVKVSGVYQTSSGVSMDTSSFRVQPGSSATRLQLNSSFNMPSFRRSESNLS